MGVALAGNIPAYNTVTQNRFDQGLPHVSHFDLNPETLGVFGERCAFAGIVPTTRRFSSQTAS